MNIINQIRSLAQGLKDARSVGYEARKHATGIVYAIERNDPKLMRENISKLSTCKGHVAERVARQIETTLHSHQLQLKEHHNDYTTQPTTDLPNLPRRRSARRAQRRRQQHADSVLRMHAEQTDRPGT